MNNVHWYQMGRWIVHSFLVFKLWLYVSHSNFITHAPVQINIFRGMCVCVQAHVKRKGLSSSDRNAQVKKHSQQL